MKIIFKSQENQKSVRPSLRFKKKAAFLNHIFLSFIVVGLLSSFFILIHQRSQFLHSNRAFLLEKTSPLTASLEKISTHLHSLFDHVSAIINAPAVYRDAASYREQMTYWKNQALHLQHENQHLRTLAKFVDVHPHVQATAQFITYPHLPFSHRCMINAGHNANIALNAPVITSQGVIGRITRVNQRSAEVLLLTEVSSRVPVYIEATDEHAILAGSHGGEVHLVLRQKDTSIPKGSRVVTSGKGGIFNPGLFVGYTHNPGSDTVILVHPTLNNVDKVFILEPYHVDD